jgi:teichuronic acid biosynthesis glycosyltransferase TuaC
MPGTPNSANLKSDMRVLMLTSVWPTAEHPELAPFVVRQADFLRKQGVAVDVFPVRGRKHPAAYWQARRKVQSLLAQVPYDLVHAQWAQSALAALPSGPPLVVTFRGSDVEGIPSASRRRTLAGWALQRISCSVARAANEAILVAERMARLLPRREYHVIPSGLDLDLFQPCPQSEAQAPLGLNPGQRYVLFAASPENPVKRFGLAQAAVERLDPGLDAKLIVASGVDPRLMPLYMNACDVLLLTSLHEGSPNVVKEALACNLAVVSTDAGDVATQIRNVDGCALCERADPEALAAALTAVLKRRQRVEGRAAVNALDESLMTRRVIGVYERALRLAVDAARSDDRGR